MTIAYSINNPNSSMKSIKKIVFQKERKNEIENNYSKIAYIVLFIQSFYPFESREEKKTGNKFNFIITIIKCIIQKNIQKIKSKRKHNEWNDQRKIQEKTKRRRLDRSIINTLYGSRKSLSYRFVFQYFFFLLLFLVLFIIMSSTSFIQ